MADKQSRTNILFYEICRLCLDDRGSCTISEANGLIENVYKCTGVNISSTDNLPQKICKSCLDIVNKAVQLRTTAYKNDQYLRTLFEDDTESIKIVSEESSTNTNEENNSEACQSDSVNSSSYIKVRKDLFLDENEVSSQTSKKSTKSHKTKRPKQNNDSSVENECKVSSRTTEKRVKSHKTKKSKKDIDNNVDHECAVSSRSEEDKEDVKPCFKVKRIKRDDETEFECTICSKVYDTWKKVYLHLRSHNKTIICPLDACGKKFATKGDLDRHVRAHTGEKPYKCNECNKCFTQNGTLKQHKLNVHNVVFS